MKVLAETQVTEVTLRLEFMPFPNTEPSQDRVATITQVGSPQTLIMTTPHETTIPLILFDVGTSSNICLYVRKLKEKKLEFHGRRK